MRAVAETEAEHHLGALLDEVELGGSIAITRQGKPVAALTSLTEDFDVRKSRLKHSAEDVHAAMLRIREQAKAAGMKFNWAEVKKWRDEGRR